MSSIFYIIIAIAVLLLMITIHELGHYSAGKLLGFKIKKFAIGMGKKLYSKTNPKTGEEFSIRIFPLGGFCEFEGGEEDHKSVDPRAFNKQKPWKRIVVLFSGVFFNFLSAIVFSIILIGVFGYTHFIKVNKLASDYVNNADIVAEHRLIEGDIIQKVNGKDLTLLDSISSFTSGKKVGDTITLTISRNGTPYTFEQSINTLVNSQTGKTYVGLGLEKGDIERNKLGFFESIGQGFLFTIELVVYMIEILGDLFTGAIPLTGVGGPIATISVMANQLSQSLYSVLFLLPLISINLAVFNLLPIPALDGARIIFIIIEWIRGKPINPDIENTIHFWGLMALFGLVIFFEINFFFFSKFLLYGGLLL